METKNLKKIAAFLAVIFIALALRLAYIQLAGHKDLSAATRAQSLIALEGSNTRGMIYDRYGEALVADSKSYVYIIKDSDYNRRAEQLLDAVDAKSVSSDNEGYHVYSSTHYDKAVGQELIEKCSAYILQASSRYSREQTAEHLIGYVNKEDLSGAAGLELMYDEQLSGLDRRIYAVADVNGDILPGRGLLISSDEQKDSYHSEGIRTSIDKGLQAEVEDIIEGYNNDCAVVVLDSSTGGVAAMACTPGFDPNDVTKYTSGTGDELMNKATQGEYPPGSTFKIVVAAAALDKGVEIDKEYFCSGHVRLDGLAVGCETGGVEGHGLIGFEDAFAQSCNSYFIQLGMDIGADEIIDMAVSMGLGKRILDGYPQESSGHMMTMQERAGNAIGNLSIGQGETLVTPLQMAAVTNIIACGGTDKGIHLLMKENGEENRVISIENAEKIANMMTLVTAEGTAANLMLTKGDGQPKAAVKTGTAEFMAGNEMMTHSWMTGFTPCEDPEYTITVLVEGGTAGSKPAGPVFKKIIEYLEESGSYSKPTLA